MVAEARVTTPIPQRARASLFAILQPIALATDQDDVHVMHQPIQERCSEHGILLRCGPTTQGDPGEPGPVSLEASYPGR